MDKVWISIFVATTIFISAEMATVEIIYTPTKVVVIKPKPYEPDMKVGRTSWDPSDEKVKDGNSSDLKIENNDLNKTGDKTNGTEHPEVKDWPSVFVLHPHPTHPVICYSGKSLNIKQNNDDEISFLKEAGLNVTGSSIRKTKKFILSSNPEYPVMCQEVYISSSSINNETADEKVNTPLNLMNNGIGEGTVNIPLNVINNGSAQDNTTVTNITCIRRDYEHNISAIFINEVGSIKSAWNVFNSSIPYGYNTVENMEIRFEIGDIIALNDTVVDCEEYGVISDDKGLKPGTADSLAGWG